MSVGAKSVTDQQVSCCQRTVVNTFYPIVQGRNRSHVEKLTYFFSSCGCCLSVRNFRQDKSIIAVTNRVSIRRDPMTSVEYDSLVVTYNFRSRYVDFIWFLCGRELFVTVERSTYDFKKFVFRCSMASMDDSLLYSDNLIMVVFSWKFSNSWRESTHEFTLRTSGESMPGCCFKVCTFNLLRDFYCICLWLLITIIFGDILTIQQTTVTYTHFKTHK